MLTTLKNKNKKKYDAILNDAFDGAEPAETLTTREAVEKIYNSLNEDGMYLTNIIASVNGEKSKFLKSEVKTLKEYFENVYVIPCNNANELNRVQNIMVIATNQEIEYENAVIVNDSEGIILTDNYNPINMMVN